MYVEGVYYHRFVISFVLADGRRRRWIRHAPARMYAAESFDREVQARDIKVKRGSNVYIASA